MIMGFVLNAYESQKSNNVAKINDVIVFVLSYFPFIYEGLVPNPEDRYSIGWAQLSLIGFMVVANFAAVL